MNHFRSIILNPIRACMLRCNNCLVTHWLDNGKEPVMTLEQVRNLCECIQKSHYRFFQADVTGGDPSLWKDLPECLRILKQAKISDRVITYSNLMWYDDSKKERLLDIASAADLLLVSCYPINKDKVEMVAKLNIKNIEWLDMRLFFPEPNRPIQYSLPAKCDCPGPTFYSDNRIYACNSIRPLEHKLKLDKNEYAGLYTNLDFNFMDKLNFIKLKTFRGCQFCVANKRVQKIAGQVPHSIKSINMGEA